MRRTGARCCGPVGAAVAGTRLREFDYLESDIPARGQECRKAFFTVSPIDVSHLSFQLSLSTVTLVLLLGDSEAEFKNGKFR